MITKVQVEFGQRWLLYYNKNTCGKIWLMEIKKKKKKNPNKVMSDIL